MGSAEELAVGRLEIESQMIEQRPADAEADFPQGGERRSRGIAFRRPVAV